MCLLTRGTIPLRSTSPKRKCLVHLAITNKNIALHTKEFADIVASEKSEPCIINGATVIDGFLARILENSEILKSIKQEFLKNKI